MKVLAVLPGPEAHGVVRHGRAVARLVAGSGAGVTVHRTLEPAPGRHDVTHVQFTDALFGPDIGSAAERFVTWARTAPRPLVVTLHDVPGTDTDARRDARRREGYRRVLAVSDAVVVSAAHEAAGARLEDGPVPVVVPLPIEPLVPPGARPDWADTPSVAVLGFVYPGKGHAEALEVVARVGKELQVVALGGASPGHEQLVTDLRRRADGLGVQLLVTGPLPEADLHAAARAATVPLAAYRTLGASGSIATWLASGRRPIASAGAHTRELESRWPGALLVCEDLDTAVAGALRDPADTWLDAPSPRPDVAQAHLAVYRSVLADQ